MGVWTLQAELHEGLFSSELLRRVAHSERRSRTRDPPADPAPGLVFIPGEAVGVGNGYLGPPGLSAALGVWWELGWGQ